MKLFHVIPLALPAIALGATAMLLPASGVGDPLPPAEFESFKQINAESFDDLAGRAVLIEFFEHW